MSEPESNELSLDELKDVSGGLKGDQIRQHQLKGDRVSPNQLKGDEMGYGKLRDDDRGAYGIGSGSSKG